jgi:hypothetical protein
VGFRSRRLSPEETTSFISAGSYEQLEFPGSFQGETLHLTLEIAQ